MENDLPDKTNPQHSLPSKDTEEEKIERNPLQHTLSPAEIEQMLKHMHKMSQQIQQKLEEFFTISGLSPQNVNELVEGMKKVGAPEIEEFQKNSDFLKLKIHKALAQIYSPIQAKPLPAEASATSREINEQDSVKSQEMSKLPVQQALRKKIREKSPPPPIRTFIKKYPSITQPNEKKPIEHKIPSPPASTESAALPESVVKQPPSTVPPKEEIPAEAVVEEAIKKEIKTAPAPSKPSPLESKKNITASSKEKSRKSKTIGERKGWISLR